MAQQGDGLFNPVTKTRIVFVTVPADNGGREMVVDWFVPPGERLPAALQYHSGPDGAVAERFEIVSGSARCRVGKQRVTINAPGAVDIGFNQVHAHPINVGDSELRVRQIGRRDVPEPEVFARVERFFETLVALSQQGKANRKGDIAHPLQAALSINDLLLDPTFIPGLPIGLQRRLFAAIARFARNRGYRAYHGPQWASAGAGSVRECPSRNKDQYDRRCVCDQTSADTAWMDRTTSRASP